eukprot:369302_1
MPRRSPSKSFRSKQRPSQTQQRQLVSQRPTSCLTNSTIQYYYHIIKYPHFYTNMSSSSSSSSSLQPLQSTLDTILARLSFLESKAGIDASSIPVAAAATATASTVASTPTSASTLEEEEIPRLVAYDEHITKALLPFVNACNSIDGLQNTGPNIQKIWNELKTIIKIGTKCKKPSSQSD